MEAIIGKILSDLGTFLFGPIMLAVFFGVGLYFTIRLRGIQFTRFGAAFREVVWNVEMKSDEGVGQIRSYKALATALSSCVGNGNIDGVAGATMGIAIRRGVQRGVFSNEAGTGSSAMVHATAKVDVPVKQALYGIIEVFFDTFVICTFTALISVQLLWDAADVCNGLMAIPKLFSLILFGGIVVKDTKDFFADYDHALSRGKAK